MTKECLILKSRTSVTKWNLFFHYASILVMAVSGLVLVPLYLEYISLADYGAWLATGNILAWVSMLDPGLSTVLQQRVGVAYGSQDFPAIRALLSGGLVLSAIFASLPPIIALLIAQHLSGWLDLPKAVNTALIIKAFSFAAVGTGFSLWSYSVTAINQGLLSSRGIGSIYLVVHIADILITLFLLHSGFGLMAVAFGFISRGVGLFVGNVGYLFWRLSKERIGFAFSRKKMGELSALLTFTSISRAVSVVANNIDSFIVARQLGVELTPVLSLTRKGPELSRALVDRPAIAFMPAISNLVGSGDLDKARSVLLRLTFIMLWAIGLIATGFLAFNDDFVRLWVGPHLFAGGTINLIICLTMLVAAICNYLSNLCISLGDIKKNSIVMFVQSSLFMGLVIVGTRYYGLLGTVLAPLVSLLVVSIWYYPRAFSRLLKLPPEAGRAVFCEVFRVLLISALLAAFFAQTNPKTWKVFVAFVFADCFLFGCTLWIFSRSFRLEFAILLGKIKQQLVRNEPGLSS